MLFNDQHVMVLSAHDDTEIDAGEWSDELDNIARVHHGYVVVINSDPPVIYADYRLPPCTCTHDDLDHICDHDGSSRPCFMCLCVDYERGSDGLQ